MTPKNPKRDDDPQGPIQITYKGTPVVTVEVTAEEMQMILEGAELVVEVKNERQED